MEKFRKNAAGIDIGAEKIFIGLENGEVESFKTFTQDFKQAVAYLLTNHVETVAMEATGIYWVV